MKNTFLNILCGLAAMAVISTGCEKGPQFTAYTYPAEQVSALSPSIGFPSQSVTITGKNFDTLKGAVKVWFGGIAATKIVSVNPTQIVVQVPANAVSGKVGVQVWTTKTDSVGIFSVLPSPSVTTVICHGLA